MVALSLFRYVYQYGSGDLTSLVKNFQPIADVEEMLKCSDSIRTFSDLFARLSDPFKLTKFVEFPALKNAVRDKQTVTSLNQNNFK